MTGGLGLAPDTVSVCATCSLLMLTHSQAPGPLLAALPLPRRDPTESRWCQHTLPAAALQMCEESTFGDTGSPDGHAQTLQGHQLPALCLSNSLPPSGYGRGLCNARVWAARLRTLNTGPARPTARVCSLGRAGREVGA